MAGPALAYDGCQAQSGNIHETELAEICREGEILEHWDGVKRDRDNRAKR